MERLRIDKWLWAARFFKTRSIAKTAIEGGKVHIDGQRVKVSREIGVGDIVMVKQGWDEKEIEVMALSDRRGPASEAQQLYAETERSLARRAKEAEARKAAGPWLGPPNAPANTSAKRWSGFANNSIISLETRVLPRQT